MPQRVLGGNPAEVHLKGTVTHPAAPHSTSLLPPGASSPPALHTDMLYITLCWEQHKIDPGHHSSTEKLNSHASIFNI